VRGKEAEDRKKEIIEQFYQGIDFIMGVYKESFIKMFNDIQDSGQRLQGMYNEFIELIEKEFKNFAEQSPDLDIDHRKFTRLVISLQEGQDIFKYMFPDDPKFDRLGSYSKIMILNILKI